MLQKARALADELVRLRRDIHQHPELAFKEVRTAALVADTLCEIGHQRGNLRFLFRPAEEDLGGEEMSGAPMMIRDGALEDFAYMTQQAPGAMFQLGAAVGDMPRGHHTPVFDIDERALPIASAILAETARWF